MLSLIEVSVRACDGQGNESAPVEQRVVVGSPLVAVLTANPSKGPTEIDNVRHPLVVQLSAEGSTSALPIVKYQWDLYGTKAFSLDTGTVPTASITLTHAGYHKIGLMITDSAGNIATTEVLVETYVEYTEPW